MSQWSRQLAVPRSGAPAAYVAWHGGKFACSMAAACAHSATQVRHSRPAHVLKSGCWIAACVCV